MKKNPIIFLSVIFIVIFCAYFFINPKGNLAIFPNLLFIVPPFLVVYSTLYAANSYGPSNKHYDAINIIFYGSSLLFIGELGIFIYQNILKNTVFPNPGDIFLSIGYILVLVGVIKEMKVAGVILFSKKILYIFLAIITIIFTLYFVYLIEPSRSIFWNLFFIIYRTTDILIIIYIIIVAKLALEYHRGKLYVPWLSIAIGSSFAVLAGILVTIFYDLYKEPKFPFTLIDMFWVAGYLFSAYGFYSIGSIIHDSYDSIYLKIKVKKLLNKSYAK